MASPSADPAASASRADESDLDPAAFLKSVRELSEKREREDAERYRKLEEEIEKSRHERAARKAERARSISPQKTVTATPSTLRLSSNASSQSTPPPPMTIPPSSSNAMGSNPVEPEGVAANDVPEFQGFRSTSRSKSSTPSTQSPALASVTSESTSKPSPSASSLARSGTLSWQQRPSSRSGGSRPTSMLVSSSSVSGSGSTEEPEQSRDQIAASLGARDPSWFRQTADRGLGNAAFRKNQDETSAAGSFVSGRRGLPGMSRPAATESMDEDNVPPSAAATSDILSRTQSVTNSVIPRGGSSAASTSTSTKPDLKSLIAEDEGQVQAAPMSEQTLSSVADGEQLALGRPPTMSSSQARIANAPERPPSPTKGMGGFVQSAMMKRSDSVTKRWSAQPGTSLSRGDSIASARSGYGGLAGSHSMPKMEPSSASTEVAEKPISKPSSSSNNLTDLATPQAQSTDGFVKPSLPSHGRSQSMVSNDNNTTQEVRTSPPSSPSKRWSPSKSTWLESAITKPESPKPNLARNSQPSWMADIAKAKAQRANAESITRPVEDSGSRSSSPTKEIFGQSILKRSESRDLGTPTALTPKPLEFGTPRSSSPGKVTTTEKSLTQSDSPNPEPASQPTLKPVESIPVEAVVKETSKAAVPVETKIEAKPSPALSSSKPKPETPPKPQTDFRSNLRPRPQTETKQEEQPEFLSRFGNLRKTRTQNYVAPDVLKDNILRGKSDLTKTGGPVKTERKDELKESLLAKKDQWKKEKDEGIVHERKVSQPPLTPQKPEALAKREQLGKLESIKPPPSLEKPKIATPEALARQKSLQEKPSTNPPLATLEKQTSLPAKTVAETATALPVKQTSTPVSSSIEPSAKQTETSKLAARFNPALANVITRGPPAIQNNADATSRSESPIIVQRSATPQIAAPSEPMGEVGQLQDMRKGRAKGPKKRKGGVKDIEHDPIASIAPASAPDPITVRSASPVVTAAASTNEAIESDSTTKPKPRALPGSAASLMVASLQKSSAPLETAKETVGPALPSTAAAEPTLISVNEKPATPAKSSISLSKETVQEKPPAPAKSTSISTAKISDDKPAAPVKKPVLGWKDDSLMDRSAPMTAVPQKPNVPEFKWFASAKKPIPATSLEDDKENAGDGSPSVKSSVSQWGKQSIQNKAQPPAQIKLPSRKDEEAAMRSAGLLSSSPTRPGSSSTSNGLGISVEKSNGVVETPPLSAEAPPRPMKSSRAVSGQLRESSPTTGGAAHMLLNAFGALPKANSPLSIDTRAVIANTPYQERSFRTIRKSVQVVSYDATLQDLPRQQEYTFFDESVYICTHAYSLADGLQKTEMFVWVGDSASNGVPEQAEAKAKRLAKDNGNASVHVVSQGLEPPGFLQAMGGILITRRGSQQGASRQYMLRGRKHVGQIVFDEVEFSVGTLCSGFAYLISYSATQQDSRLYLWKGSACSTEELSGARLAAADLNGSREVIEVDDGAEFASFLKIFGSGTTKTSIPKPTEIWQQKSLDPDKFVTRLFKIQPAEAKGGIFSSIFTRRPSWGNLSPARRDENQTKLEAKELSPFTQSDLEADCIYLLDAYSSAHVLVGPVFATQPESVRNLLFGQTLLFAADYAVLVASADDRPFVPKGYVLLNGVPQEMKLLFRHWDDSTGLWGASGLLNDSQAPNQNDLKVLDLNEVLSVVCKT